jgi:hypothetical protein
MLRESVPFRNSRESGVVQVDQITRLQEAELSESSASKGTKESCAYRARKSFVYF